MDAFLHLLGQAANAASTYQWEPGIQLPVVGSGPAPGVTLESFISYLYGLLVGLAGLFAFIRLVQAGIMWGGSGGNITSVMEARKIIMNVMFGLALILFSWAILNTINPDILNPDIRLPAPQALLPATGPSENALRLAQVQNRAAVIGIPLTSFFQALKLIDVEADVITSKGNIAPTLTMKTKERATISVGGSPINCTGDVDSIAIQPVPWDYTNAPDAESQSNITTDEKLEEHFDIPAGTCYTIAYRNIGCLVSQTGIDNAVATLWGTSDPQATPIRYFELANTQKAADNLKGLWPEIQKQALRYKFNPIFVLALWLEESAAGGNTNIHELGCEQRYSQFSFDPLQIPRWTSSGPDGVSGMSNYSNICQQMGCLFQKESAQPDSFARFMCGWSNEQNGPGCSFGDPAFPGQVAFWYYVLTKGAGGSCGLQLNGWGC